MFEVGKHYKDSTCPAHITVLVETEMPPIGKVWVAEQNTWGMKSLRVFCDDDCDSYTEMTSEEWDAVFNPPKFEAGKFYLSRAGHMWAVRALNEKGESIVECVTTDGVPSCFAAQATTLGTEWGEISKDEWERTRAWREGRRETIFAKSGPGDYIWDFSQSALTPPGPYAIHRAMLPFGEPDPVKCSLALANASGRKERIS